MLLPAGHHRSWRQHGRLPRIQFRLVRLLRLALLLIIRSVSSRLMTDIFSLKKSRRLPSLLCERRTGARCHLLRSPRRSQHIVVVTQAQRAVQRRFSRLRNRIRIRMIVATASNVFGRPVVTSACRLRCNAEQVLEPNGGGLFDGLRFSSLSLGRFNFAAARMRCFRLCFSGEYVIYEQVVNHLYLTPKSCSAHPRTCPSLPTRTHCRQSLSTFVSRCPPAAVHYCRIRSAPLSLPLLALHNTIAAAAAVWKTHRTLVACYSTMTNHRRRRRDGRQPLLAPDDANRSLRIRRSAVRRSHCCCRCCCTESQRAHTAN